MSKMRRSSALAVCTVLWILPALGHAQGYNVSLSADKADPVYKLGETIQFLASPSKDGKPADAGTVEYTLTKDVGGPVLGSGKLKANGKPLIITARLNEPGFVTCATVYKAEPKAAGITSLAGAAVEPLKIKPSLPIPDDFDAFWNGYKKKLAALPMKIELKPVAVDPKINVEAFDITINCLGPRPMRGYFARPKNAKPKACPAYANYHAFDGFHDCSLGLVTSLAANGYLAIDVNAHGIETGQPKEYYDRLRAQTGWFPSQGWEDRNTFYLLGMYLRDLRALQFMTSRPQWDGKVLIVHGSSMGGGQSVAMGGLEPRVSLVLANVPALCDHTAFKVNRVCGWNRHVVTAPPAVREKVLRTLRYFDGMNFATRFKGAAVFSCGFQDGVCPSTSVYAAFNNVPSTDKLMVYEPSMSHATSQKIQEAFGAASVRQVLAAHPTTSPAK